MPKLSCTAGQYGLPPPSLPFLSCLLQLPSSSLAQALPLMAPLHVSSILALASWMTPCWVLLVFPPHRTPFPLLCALAGWPSGIRGSQALWLLGGFSQWGHWDEMGAGRRVQWGYLFWQGPPRQVPVVRLCRSRLLSHSLLFITTVKPQGHKVPGPGPFPDSFRPRGVTVPVFLAWHTGGPS